MGSAAPTSKRAIGRLACGSDSGGRIDLIVPRVIIMMGRARLSSRGCERIWPCAGVWLLGAWSASQRVAGNRHHIPKANWLQAYSVLQRLHGSLTSN